MVLGPIPSDFVLKNDYYTDCQQVVDHMRYAVQMEKGNSKLAEVAQKTKDEMSEFVSFYRRFNVRSYLNIQNHDSVYREYIFSSFSCTADYCFLT